MDISGKTPVFFARPADRSLEAFKDWINSMAAAVGATDEISEEEWQAFWFAGADRSKNVARNEEAADGN